jgi:hypothetical protein
MGNKCYHLLNKGCNGGDYEFFVCAASLETQEGGDCGGVKFFVNGQYTGSAKSTTIEIVNCQQCAGCSCDQTVDPNAPCDCLNGGCVPASTYGTPGAYASYTDCIYGCAKNADCKGVCISANELANLQRAANESSPCIGTCVSAEEMANLKQAAANLQNNNCR